MSAARVMVEYVWDDEAGAWGSWSRRCISSVEARPGTTPAGGHAKRSQLH